MAFNFLALSPTYQSGTPEHLRCQREVVVEHLTDKYKATKGRDEEIFSAVQEELAVRGMTMTLPEYKEDKVLYRGLYRWLRAADDEDRDEALASIRRAALPIVEWLQQDGIASWADVRRLRGEVAHGEDEEEDGSTGAEAASAAVRLEARDSQVGDALAAHISGLFPAIEAVLNENEALKREVVGLGEENYELRGRITELQTLLELSAGQTNALEDQLRTAKEGIRNAHRARMEVIALEYPDVPQLLTLAQQLKDRPRGQREELQAFASRLPQRFTWTNDQGEVRYGEQFLRALLRFSREEQDQVIRQIGLLAEQGPEHASLHTRKNRHGGIPFSPMPCMSSRGAHDLRFSWRTFNREVQHLVC